MRIVNDTNDIIALQLDDDGTPVPNADPNEPSATKLNPGNFIDVDGAAEVAISQPLRIALTFKSGITSLGAGESGAGLRVRGDDGGLKKEGTGGSGA